MSMFLHWNNTVVRTPGIAELEQQEGNKSEPKITKILIQRILDVLIGSKAIWQNTKEKRKRLG